MKIKKDKHLRVRITGIQLRRLMSRINKENISISVVLRDLIDGYLDGSCRVKERGQIKF